MSDSYLFAEPAALAGESLPPEPPPEPLPEDRRVGLSSPSFVGLLLTQFLVAWNDNMFRWLIVPIGQDLAGEGNEALVLSVGLACFVLPYLLLAAPAGWLADRFSKRTIIVGCKAAEVAIMSLGMATILWGNLYGMFVMVALMGAQSALFSPAKLGAIPELVGTDKISKANGVFGLVTVLAIVGGTVAGKKLYELTSLEGLAPGHHRWWVSAAALVGVAAVGLAASLMIRRLRPANPARPFPTNAPRQTFRDLAHLAAERPLFLAAVGSAFFWWLGALTQLNVDLFGQTVLFVSHGRIGVLLGLLALGVGLGSVLAGLLARGRIDLGMVPFGTGVIALAAVLLSTVPSGSPSNPATGGFYLTCAWLVLLGIGGGLFEIPLQAFLQHRSPEESRGSVMAAYNFLGFSGMLAVSGIFWVLSSALGLSARHIFLVAGLLSIPVAVTVVRKLSYDTTRFAAGLLKSMMYRVRVEGLENVPAQGGALLVSNHVSYADGMLLALSLPRQVRMVVYADYCEVWWLRWFWRLARPIPIRPGKRSVVASLRTARGALLDGELVGIFPEGGLTRDGQMQAFQPGFLRMVEGVDVPVVPVHLGGLWGSIFSFERGKFFWKIPRRWPYPITIRFGPPIERPEDAEQVQRAVAELAGEDGEAEAPPEGV
jgi:acyl-[acyl-carrier-protein]-phospholipid O-acyltransferase/long-chain-fatty-acid--[acyl-carrier-protein] ligase